MRDTQRGLPGGFGGEKVDDEAGEADEERYMDANEGSVLDPEVTAVAEEPDEEGEGNLERNESCFNPTYIHSHERVCGGGNQQTAFVQVPQSSS